MLVCIHSVSVISYQVTVVIFAFENTETYTRLPQKTECVCSLLLLTGSNSLLLALFLKSVLLLAVLLAVPVL